MLPHRLLGFSGTNNDMSDQGVDDSKPSTPASPSSNRSRIASPPHPSDAVSSQIQVFARIRPSKRFSPTNLQFDPYSNAVTLTLPTAASLPSTATPQHADQYTRDYVNNSRLVYPFAFHGLFPPSTTQDTVFDTIGKQCVTSLLDGYNSTIFAYGQTGSGKTYTITGGADSYEDRGIIPRTLSYLFGQLEGRQADNVAYTVRVSYLEIYNEAGYDLLDRPADMSDLASIAASSLASLPRVTLLEDDNRCVHLQNLGEYAVTNVQDALELLFRGDTNRIVCETPSNDASSRSHCLFTVTLEARDAASGKLRRSKLHLVDLAGSERIKKTQVTGRLFKEAAFINLSLHHLEQVILALHHRSNGRSTVHVPYRNSFLTSTLRDSLGGNCRTYMIATLSGEAAHIDESVSTARFAGRVGSIRNEVWREEEEDMEGVMKRLKGQVKELKEEVRRLRGEEGVGRGEVLSDEDKERCKEIVRRYVWCAASEEAEVSQQVSVAHQEKVRFYLKLMKDIIRSGGKGDGAGGSGAAAEPTAVKAEAEVKRLSDVVQEREEEISRLKEALLHAQQQSQAQQQSKSSPTHSIPNASPASTSFSAAQTSPASHPSSASSASAASDPALDSFRLQYAQHEQLEQRKDELNALIRTAKSLGESINASKQHILHLKQRLTAHTLNRTLAQQDNQPADALEAMEAAERAVVVAMEEEKRRYRDSFGELKVKKEEIVHLQGLIERGRRKMEVEFDKWKKSRQDNEADSTVNEDEEEQRQQHIQEHSRERHDSQRQKQHQPVVSRRADERHHSEEVKEQVTAAPQPYPRQPVPANSRPMGREVYPLDRSQPAVHSAAPLMSPLRAGALSSLMLGQPSTTVPPGASAAAGGGSSASGVSAGVAGAGRVVRTGNASADAEIDKFWALRDKLKSHAVTMQQNATATTALK